MSFVNVRVTRFLSHDAQRGLTSDRLVTSPLLRRLSELLFSLSRYKAKVQRTMSCAETST